MSNLKTMQIIALAVLLAGCLFMAFGAVRGEHKTVEKKSTMICMECIGIG